MPNLEDLRSKQIKNDLLHRYYCNSPIIRNNMSVFNQHKDESFRECLDKKSFNELFEIIDTLKIVD